MVGDVKRWSVTYTKHIKQKRKVYQDGFLEVQSSSHKVILYDDCEKVLGSKFIKIENDVESGQTLAFDSYLVDIGDIHGDHKPIVNKTSEARDKHIGLKPRSLHNQKFRNNSAVEDKKPNFREKKALSSSLSPSQKLIREFKKGEVKKYSSSPSCLDVTQSCEEEWQVLYTTQLTQKAKKFHDGFLRISMNGSQCKKAMLYDAAKGLLDSSFQKPLLDSKFQGGKVMHDKLHSQHYSPAEFKKGEMHKYSSSPSCVYETKSGEEEWQVMYTTQLIQKAKKFHDGFLRVSLSGSHCKKAMLYDAAKGLLDSRFLKTNENIKCGNSITFDGFLVEIGECAGNQKPLLDSNFQGGHIEVMQDSLHSQHKYPVEWDVMYTSQVCQKRKKYNSGVLRLSSCGSFQYQVTLLTEEGNTLGRRFLKSSEHVETGVTLNLPNYLVDVGDAHTIQKEPQRGGDFSHKNNISISKRFSMSIAAKNPSLGSDSATFHSEAQNITSLPEDINFNTRSSTLASSTMGSGIDKKHVRAACEILSILKKPIVLMESASTEKTRQSSKEKIVCKEEETSITDTTPCGKHANVDLSHPENSSGTKSKIFSESVSSRGNETRETQGASTDDLPTNLSMKKAFSARHESSVEIGMSDGKEEEAIASVKMEREEKSFGCALGVMKHFQEPKECQVESLCSVKSDSIAFEMAVDCDTKDSFELNTSTRKDNDFPSFDLGF
ncbi:unnamed protein product [Cuscuta campestris]|uniref:5'-3' DNA helicase ZGRF1-like N-terminal domain-containing protein n=1 Tax=Cuscuta campestris TaxID=132261 RepID=A0A484KTN0_9ASTE|nr:unnamed protein product [Cuscuta campestris]